MSAALIYWVCKGIDWPKVSGEFLTANYWILVPSICLIMLQFLLRCMRWRYLLDDSDIPLGKLFDSLMLGNFATFILPLRAGEIVRPFYPQPGN